MRRNRLAERIEWLESFPHRMTVGALLKALRIVNRSVRPQEPPQATKQPKEAE